MIEKIDLTCYFLIDHTMSSGLCPLISKDIWYLISLRLDDQTLFLMSGTVLVAEFSQQRGQFGIHFWKVPADQGAVEPGQDTCGGFSLQQKLKSGLDDFFWGHASV